MYTQEKPDTTQIQVERDHALHLLHQMLRIRRFEEKAAELYSATKIRGFLHLYDGEEAVAVGVIEALRPDDNIVATYREHGQALARGVSMGAVMAELYGKQEGCSRGRGGSMHIFDKDTNFFGGNAIVGGGLPIALGLGLAAKKLAEDRLTFCFFGDGAAAEGEFHETMNLSALWDVPVLYVCENNQYGMGTALQYSQSVTDIASHAASYGITARKIDGMDVLAVEAAAKDAVESIRTTGKPYFLECVTYRFRAHSMFDAELYREKEEVEQWRERGPIITFIKRLKAADLLTDEDLEQIESDVREEIEEAVAFAEAGSWEPVEDLTRFVYSEGGT